MADKPSTEADQWACNGVDELKCVALDEPSHTGAKQDTLAVKNVQFYLKPLDWSDRTCESKCMSIAFKRIGVWDGRELRVDGEYKWAVAIHGRARSQCRSGGGELGQRAKLGGGCKGHESGKHKDIENKIPRTFSYNIFSFYDAFPAINISLRLIFQSLMLLVIQMLKNGTVLLLSFLTKKTFPGILVEELVSLKKKKIVGE